ETLFHADERYRPTAHPKILQAEARGVSSERITAAMARLRDAVSSYDLETLDQALRDAVPEFAPLVRDDEPAAATVVAFPARNARRTWTDASARRSSRSPDSGPASSGPPRPCPRRCCRSSIGRSSSTPWTRRWMPAATRWCSSPTATSTPSPTISTR